MQSVLVSSSKESDRDGTPTSLNIGVILSSSGSSAMDSQNFHLSKWQAIQLWQAFVNNVDPLTKILHIPTAHITVFTAINNPSEVVEDVNALLFSIYFAATTSLPADDAMNLLGQGKSIALKIFKQDLEQSLARANILDNPSLTLLQALAIYLVSIVFLIDVDEKRSLQS